MDPVNYFYSIVPALFLSRNISAESVTVLQVMATSMVLYGDIFSTPTRLVTCTMELLGLKYEFKAVDIRRGENLTTSFQKVQLNVVRTI